MLNAGTKAGRKSSRGNIRGKRRKVWGKKRGSSGKDVDILRTPMNFYELREEKREIYYLGPGGRLLKKEERLKRKNR